MDAVKNGRRVESKGGCSEEWGSNVSFIHYTKRDRHYYSLYMVLFEECNIRECPNHVLIDDLT